MKLDIMRMGTKSSGFVYQKKVIKHGTHDQSTHNPHKGGGGGNQSSEYPTSKSHPELKDAISDYVVQYPKEVGHTIMNGTLREQQGYDNVTPEYRDDINSRITQMDKLVELSPALTENTTTFRGIGSGFAQELREKGIGAKYTDNGFTSVSLDKDVAGGFPSLPSGNIMEIVLPTGIKAINPSRFFTSGRIGDTELKREKELILGRGTNFEVLSIEDSPYGFGNLFKVGIKQ